MSVKSESKDVVLSYCKARMLQKGKSLQQLLRSAAKKLDTIEKRTESLGGADGGSGVVRFLNDNMATKGMQFGVLLMYTPGKNAAVMEMIRNQQNAKVFLLAPKSKDGSRQEFLESMLYFGVLDNHLILKQAARLRFTALDAHLNWFLHEAGVFSKDDGLSLEKAIDFKLKEQIKKTESPRLL